MERIKEKITNNKIISILLIFLFCFFSIFSLDVRATSDISINKNTTLPYLEEFGLYYAIMRFGASNYRCIIPCDYVQYNSNGYEFCFNTSTFNFLYIKEGVSSIRATVDIYEINNSRDEWFYVGNTTYYNTIMNGVYADYSTIDIYGGTKDNYTLFFQKTPPVVTITEIAQVEELPKMIAKTMKVIIPTGLVILSMVLLISLIKSVILRMK